MKRTVMKKAFFLCTLSTVLFLSCIPSWADAAASVGRIFELNGKLRPGMTLEALSSLLGPSAEEHAAAGKDSGINRHLWLHGEMGIEVYFMKDIAHKVNITLPLKSEKDALKALDAFTRQGQARYGSMPRFDSSTGEYYWIAEGVRFGYSKYNSNTVRSSCTRMQ